MRPIGYYVHHHGDGHRQRALAIARAAGGRITLLGTGLTGRTGDIPAIDLPDDRLAGRAFDGDDGGGAPRALHYAPIDHPGIRARVAAITGWIASTAPALIVIDVSVEVAMLARLASVPTVVVRLAGRRDDPPHRDAFAAARALLAPFAAVLDGSDVAPDVRGKTVYFPGLTARPPRRPIEPDLIVVVVGRGGTRADGESWAAAARATPGWRWRVIGTCTPPAMLPANLDFAGWVEDPAAQIAAAAIVVGGAGNGVVNVVIATRARFVCLPEDRPFDEQRRHAHALAAAGAAVVCNHWPADADWPGLLAAAAALDTDRMAVLDDDDAARRGADWLAAIAAG